MNFTIKPSPMATINEDYLTALNDVQAAYESFIGVSEDIVVVDRTMNDIFRACNLVGRSKNVTETLQLLDISGDLTAALQKDISTLDKMTALESLSELAREALKKFLNACLKVWEYLKEYFGKLLSVFHHRREENKDFSAIVKEAEKDTEWWNRFGQAVPDEMNQGATESFNYFGYLTKELMPADDTIACMKTINQFADRMFDATDEWFEDFYRNIMAGFEALGQQNDPERLQHSIDEMDKCWQNFKDDLVALLRSESNRFFKYEYNEEKNAVDTTVVYTKHLQSKTIAELGWAVKGKIQTFLDEYNRYTFDAESRHNNVVRISKKLRELTNRALNEMDSIQNPAQSKQIQTVLRTCNALESSIVARDVQLDKVFKKHRNMLERALEQSRA